MVENGTSRFEIVAISAELTILMVKYSQMLIIIFVITCRQNVVKNDTESPPDHFSLVR